MSCNEGARNLTLYLDGSLAGEVRRLFETHLETCGECRQELDLWIRLEDLPAPSPSPALRRDFERALAAEIAPRRRQPVMPWFGWAAAAMVLVASGWLLGRQTAAAPVAAAELSALRVEVGGLRSMVALSLLAQESASARLQGVSYAGRLKQESPDVLGALISALRYDSNVNVRLAACDALRAFRSDATVRHAFTAALSVEESPLVKVSLIDTVADFGDRDSVRPLQRLSASGQEDSLVRERAARALEQMKSKGIQWE